MAYFKADAKYFLHVGEVGSSSLQQERSNFSHQVPAGFSALSVLSFGQLRWLIQIAASSSSPLFL